MGKNIQGGKKAKSMARQNGNQNIDLPVVVSTEEEYVIVNSVSGNGRFRVTNEKGVVYVAVVPGSMRGRKKRNNYVETNSFLLINNRSSWQTLKPLAHVDVEYVYSKPQAQQLRLFDKFSEMIRSQMMHSNHDNSDVQFSNNVEEVIEKQENTEESYLDTCLGGNSFNIDDI
jgi:hypothetical protein